MKILSNIESIDLDERLATKKSIYKTFTEINTSQSVNINIDSDGHIFYLNSSTVVLEIVYHDLPIGASITIIGPSTGTSSVTTGDTAFPTSLIDLSAGQHVECTWDGAQWYFIGNYTI